MKSTQGKTHDGPERRRFDRAPPAPPRAIGRARVRREHARHALSLAPGRWYPLIEQPADVLMPPLDGYVWIDLDGRPRSVSAAFLEQETPMPAKSKPPRSPQELYEVLIQLQQACFEAGSIEAAYHALAAAMHAAEDAGMTAGLHRVIAVAEERQQALDSAEPAAELSSSEAGKRGTSPLFATLVTIAKSILARQQGERAVTRSESGRPRPKP
jgi:hypothetical protein